RSHLARMASGDGRGLREFSISAHRIPRSTSTSSRRVSMVSPESARYRRACASLAADLRQCAGPSRLDRRSPLKIDLKEALEEPRITRMSRIQIIKHGDLRFQIPFCVAGPLVPIQSRTFEIQQERQLEPADGKIADHLY